MSVICFDAGPLETACSVCGSAELRRDEVELASVLTLLECGRCGFRVTLRERPASIRRGREGAAVLEASREVANAA